MKLSPRLSHTIRCAVALLIVFLLWLMLLFIATNRPTTKLHIKEDLNQTKTSLIADPVDTDPAGLTAPSPTPTTVTTEDPPTTERPYTNNTSRSQPQPGSAVATNASAESSGGVGEPSIEDLDRLGACESGQNPTDDTGNDYYGAFQFLISTWNSLGYPGNPVNYSYETQRTAAGQLIVQSGWGQFPGCARKLGKL